MNMNKALQNLYHAVSNETTTKVNISKLLVDIHYAITGKESENKNNWSKIVNSMADNWPEGGGGGGGSSDFSTATVTVVTNDSFRLNNSIIVDDEFGELITDESFDSGDYLLLLYKGEFGAIISAPEGMHVANATGSGGVSVSPSLGGAYAVTITGDGTLNVTVE